MIQMFSILLTTPAIGLIRLNRQEQNGSGLTWGWILLILLIVALLILWWLLGPGARRRRKEMSDLPKLTPGVSPKMAEASTVAAPKPSSPPEMPAAPTIAPPIESLSAAEEASAIVDIAEEADNTGVSITDSTADTASEAVAHVAGEAAEEDDPVPATPVDDVTHESAAAVLAEEPDNLRKIEGIGPKVAGILIANGISTFAALSATSTVRLADILEAEGLKFMKPDTWPEQAAFAAAGDWDGLQKFQDQLKGGRRIAE